MSATGPASRGNLSAASSWRERAAAASIYGAVSVVVSILVAANLAAYAGGVGGSLAVQFLNDQFRPSNDPVQFDQLSDYDWTSMFYLPRYSIECSGLRYTCVDIDISGWHSHGLPRTFAVYDVASGWPAAVLKGSFRTYGSEVANGILLSNGTPIPENASWGRLEAVTRGHRLLPVKLDPGGLAISSMFYFAALVVSRFSVLGLVRIARRSHEHRLSR